MENNLKIKYSNLFVLDTPFNKNDLLIPIILIFYNYQYFEEISFDVFDSFKKENYALIIDNLTTIFDLKQLLNNYSSEKLNRESNFFVSFENNFDINSYNDSMFHFGLIVKEFNAKIQVKVVYNSKRYSELSIKGVINNLKYLCEMSFSNEIRISEISVLSAIEYSRVKKFFKSKNNIEAPISLAEMFYNMTNLNPDKIAISDGKNINITYKNLNRLTDYYAQEILNKTNDLKANIGIYFKDEIKAVIAIFSVIKSGQCFVLLNSNNPPQRTNYMLEDAKIDILLYDDNIIDLNCNFTIQIDIFHSIPKTIFNSKQISSDLDNPSYIIYTSGTTGNPKGIIISQRSLSIIINWFINYFPLDSSIKSLHVLSYTFDFGLYDILSTVLCGGTLYIPNKRTLHGYTEYCNMINNYKINNLCITPSLCNIITSADILMESLKIIHIGGEILTYEMIEKYKKVIRKDCKIYNGYGPSECTIGNSIYEVTHLKNNSSVPIGFPNGNSIIFILNKYKKILPIGALGEICIAGEGLGMGYIGNIGALKTFCSNLEGGIYIYESGDLGYWNDEGSIQYVKRVQQDIKINGYRVDILEIENAIQSYPIIKECCVIANNTKGITYLIAYVITDLDINKEEKKIKRYLKDFLPQYMIPVKFIKVDKFPVTNSGKVNKKELIKIINR